MKTTTASGLKKKFKRVFSGRSIFTTSFENQHQEEKAKIGFSPSSPGTIVAITPKNGIFCQRGAFLAASEAVSFDAALSKSFKVGFFGGEGFVMQKLKGEGICFLQAGGSILEIELKEKEKMFVDTGCVVAYETSVVFDVKQVSGIKNKLLGGEGLFLATLQGPGRVWVQSMPFERLVAQIGQRVQRSHVGAQNEHKNGQSVFSQFLEHADF